MARSLPQIGERTDVASLRIIRIFALFLKFFLKSLLFGRAFVLL